MKKGFYQHLNVTPKCWSTPGENIIFYHNRNLIVEGIVGLTNQLFYTELKQKISSISSLSDEMKKTYIFPRS